jgi:hypothetical protein
MPQTWLQALAQGPAEAAELWLLRQGEELDLPLLRSAHGRLWVLAAVAHHFPHLWRSEAAPTSPPGSPFTSSSTGSPNISSSSSSSSGAGAGSSQVLSAALCLEASRLLHDFQAAFEAASPAPALMAPTGPSPARRTAPASGGGRQ